MSDALSLLSDLHYQICNGGLAQACYNGYIDDLDSYGGLDFIKDIIEECGKNSDAAVAASMIVDAMNKISLVKRCPECDGNGELEDEDEDGDVHSETCRECDGEGTVSADDYSEIDVDMPWMDQWDEQYYNTVDSDAIDDLTGQSHTHSVALDTAKSAGKNESKLSLRDAKRILREHAIAFHKTSLL